MKKLLSLLGTLTMITTSVSTVIACNPSSEKKDPKDENNDLDKQALSDVLKITNLGRVFGTPTSSNLLQLLGEKNPELQINELEITINSNQEAKAVVKKNSSIYKADEIDLTYRSKSIEIKEDFKETHLGKFAKIPSKEEILKRIHELNPNLDLSQIDIDTSDINDGWISANLSTLFLNGVYWSKNQVFSDEEFANQIRLSFEFENMDYLFNQLKVQDLGTFNDEPSIEQVKERIKELNNNVDTTQLEITGINKGQIFLGVKKGSKIYWGQSNLRLIYDTNKIKRYRVSKHLINFNLDHQFETMPTQDEILARIKELNPDLDLTQFTFETNDGLFTLRLKENSSVYWFEEYKNRFSFELKIKGINEVLEHLTTWKLGAFDDEPSVEQVKERIKAYNPDLDISQINIQQINSGIVKIEVKDSSVYYDSLWTELVFFVKNKIRNVRNDIRTYNLGHFDTVPDKNDFIKKIQELNPDLDISQLEITDIRNYGINVEVKADSKVYLQERYLGFDYQIAGVKHLREIFKNIYLGEFTTIPTSNDILERIQELSSWIDVTQLQIISIDNNTVEIQARSDSKKYWSGERETLEYQVKGIKHLKDDLTKTDLGEFDVDLNENDIDLILEKIQELNPDLDIAQIEVINIYQGSIQIQTKSDSTKYWSEEWETLEYQVKGIKHLKDDLTKTDLGEFENHPTKDEILKIIKDLNPNVDFSQLEEINEVNEGRFWIKTSSQSTKYWPSEWEELRYQVKGVQELWEVIKFQDLGQFLTFPTQEDVYKRIQELNPNLDMSQFTIENINYGRLYIKVKADSTKYWPGEERSFDYKVVGVKDLSDDLNVEELGEFSKIPTDEEILNRIQELNPRLDLSQIEIDTSQINYWISVRVKADSTKYWPGETINLYLDIIN